MSIWFRRPNLNNKEEVIMQVTANIRKSFRSIGGKLTVTNDRLIFLPNRLDRWTGSRDLYVRREDIRDVRAAGARGFASSTFPMQSVEVDHAEGTERFIVRDAGSVVKLLNH